MKEESQIFRVKKQIYYFAWHCFAPYAFLGYFMTIPSAAEPSWLKINQTKHKYKIDFNWMNVAFLIGYLLASGIEMKGNLRQIMIKCETMLIVALVLQWFLPFREGTLIIRVFMGALINLDIKYSNIYFKTMMRPIEVYIRKKFPDQLNVKNLGQYLCQYQYVAFGIGWTIQGLMAYSYPKIEMLNKLKIYDDCVLWNLLISLPTVFLAIRLINLHLSFNYDDLKTCTPNEAEYFLANMFKKANVEEVIDMYHEKRLIDNDEYELDDQKTLKIIQIIMYSSSTMMLVFFLNRLNTDNNGTIYQSMPFHYFIFGLSMILANYLPCRLFYKVPQLLLYRLSLFMSIIINVALIISIQIQSYYFILISCILAIFSNGLGLFSFTSSYNYFVDDFMPIQLCQGLSLAVLVGLEFFIRDQVFSLSLMITTVLGIFIWRRVQQLIEQEEEDEDNAKLIM
ncbi:unnamed protein product [Paramecium sonneborni]|uniref:Uncharacterized protein n=1 Tax=Paramecium sonneborni TaxID=65129 RepID=A0A8S1QSV0_9CILI|nr:unnamed protein product [Paramecium sonneborni]